LTSSLVISFGNCSFNAAMKRYYHCDARISLTQRVIQGIPTEAEAWWSGGLDRSSDEVSVMGMKRRVQLIGLH